ncbi:Elongation factor 1-beta [Phytophthora boehmeriae]|uniref:RxLR effector protein n=1 Tax=Phytophthora boehmeriae TaxID=109152 RepID=A0A8T1V3P6_9STRA|nr:Elongation factor 1-beta [Phytophthora boehmeriae]
MRTVFYVAVAVAVLARSSVVAAFANADESKLLSKATPDFTADTVISSDSRKRFLRVTDPEDDGLVAADEERVKFASMKQIIAKLEEDDMKHVAKILEDFQVSQAKSALKAARERVTWGNGDKLVPVAFGIKKLLVQCVIVDDLVLLDDITESIEQFEDYVQSVDVASMNKL